MQDHLAALCKKFKRDDAASAAASEISEEPSERDVFVREYLELAEIPKPVKPKRSLDGSSVKELALRRLRDLPDHSENAGSEPSTTEARSFPGKRTKEAILMDILSEQAATSRITLEEDAEIKKVKIRQDEEKIAHNRVKLDYQIKKPRRTCASATRAK